MCLVLISLALGTGVICKWSQFSGKEVFSLKIYNLGGNLKFVKQIMAKFVKQIMAEQKLHHIITSYSKIYNSFCLIVC